MSRYRRAQVPGATYFFTVNLRNRRSDLLVRHAHLLRETIRHQRAPPVSYQCWVVLPDQTKRGQIYFSAPTHLPS